MVLLIVLCIVDVVAEVEAGDVVVSKVVLEGHEDGCLGLFWGGYY